MHEADAAFLELKRVMSTAPVLAPLTQKEPMLMYIATTNRVISVVLVVEHREEGKEQPVQRPVYYLSEVLSQSKQNYLKEQTMSRMSPRGGVKRRLTLFLFRGLIIAE